MKTDTTIIKLAQITSRAKADDIIDERKKIFEQYD